MGHFDLFGRFIWFMVKADSILASRTILSPSTLFSPFALILGTRYKFQIGNFKLRLQMKLNLAKFAHFYLFLHWLCTRQWDFRDHLEVSSQAVWAGNTFREKRFIKSNYNFQNASMESGVLFEKGEIYKEEPS